MIDSPKLTARQQEILELIFYLLHPPNLKNNIFRPSLFDLPFYFCVNFIKSLSKPIEYASNNSSGSLLNAATNGLVKNKLGLIPF